MHNEFIAKRFRETSGRLTLNMEALRRFDDVIDLSIGDTDFTTDDRVIDAAFRDTRAGYTHYGDPKGDPELIDAIRRAWREDFGQELSPDEVIVTASGLIGMALVMFATLDPGDEAIVFSPYFAIYREQIELAGGVCVEVPTYAEEGYAISEERLRAAITPRTRLLVLNNPVNPTGAAYGREALELLVRVARERDLLIVADEIYTAYLYEGDFCPIRTLPGAKERTVTINSFSKNFLMTGWRVGSIIAEPELVRTVNRVNGALIYSAPSVSQRAAIAALAARERIRREYVAKYRERVFYSADRIEKIPYLGLCRPKGTFYLFPDVKRTGLSSERFCAELLERAHILVSAGNVFGKAGEGHFRIACTVDEARLKEAFDRMEKLSF
ncbi:MAG: aminotransferase class I/II-fold pyridoxal phosphate-dependent enzyme [Ruminococcaceae bacterium]|nr:aminotransferase class I/II-fold pyridoxal phosphate-dependent enzyme [Oscillospiraceae bacterium]